MKEEVYSISGQIIEIPFNAENTPEYTHNRTPDEIDIIVSSNVGIQEGIRRRMARTVNGAIVATFYDGELETIVQIGKIRAFKIAAMNSNGVMLWADAISTDVCKAFDWLLNSFKGRRDIDCICDDFIFDVLFIDDVGIKPEYRGHFSQAAKCIATFIDATDTEFVFGITGTKPDPKLKIPLNRFWSKLGFNISYSKRSQVTFAWRVWGCPKWLMAEADDLY